MEPGLRKKLTEIQEYVKLRDEALLSLDKEKIINLSKSSDYPIPEDETTFWAGVHYARLQVKNFPDEVKEESIAWLMANGFTV